MPQGTVQFLVPLLSNLSLARRERKKKFLKTPQAFLFPVASAFSTAFKSKWFLFLLWVFRAHKRVLPGEELEFWGLPHWKCLSAVVCLAFCKALAAAISGALSLLLNLLRKESAVTLVVVLGSPESPVKNIK